jgi:multiple sugar transport system substrate-binding protein
MTTKPALEELQGREPHGGLATQLANYEGLTVNGMEAIWRAGGHINFQKGETGDTKKIIVDQAAVEGLNQLINGVESLSPILKESTDFQESDSLAAFTEGRVLFLRNWPYAYSVIAADPFLKKRFGVAALPGTSDSTLRSGALGGHSLVIPKNAHHKKEASELIKFLTSFNQQERGFACNSSVPVIKEAYEPDKIAACSKLSGQKQPNLPDDSDPVHRQQQLLELAKILKHALEDAQPRPAVPYYSGFSRTFHRYIHEMIDRDWTISGPSQLSEQLTACAGGIPLNSEYICP